MRFLLGMCALLTLPLWATTQLTTQIHDIDHGEHITDEALVFLKNGQVVKVNVNEPRLYEELAEAQMNHQTVDLEIGEDREILALNVRKDLPEPEPQIEPKLLLQGPDPLAGYNPSVASPELARQMFREQRNASKEETQCFNRAHIWTYEWRVKHNFYSKKIWIFFTRKFIRRHNFDWWFHVSPMINVVEDGQIKERTMDKKYSRGPLPLQKWAHIFLRGENVLCPYVRHYSEHNSMPEGGSCFFQKSSMYYYQPVDLEFLDKFGSVRSSWSEADVRAAYAEAFEIYP